MQLQVFDSWSVIWVKVILEKCSIFHWDWNQFRYIDPDDPLTHPHMELYIAYTLMWDWIENIPAIHRWFSSKRLERYTYTHTYIWSVWCDYGYRALLIFNTAHHCIVSMYDYQMFVSNKFFSFLDIYSNCYFMAIGHCMIWPV